MRTVNIDLNKLQEQYFLGFTNEHLITTLNIRLTDDLVPGDMFSLKFSVFGTRKIVSDLRAVDGVITYVLPQDITGIINRQCQVLIQVTAYLEGVIIGKSALINGELDDGLEALDPIEPTLITIVDEVHFNTAERHNHTNRATIDLFSTGDNDELLWGGEPIETDIDLSEYAKKSEIPVVPTKVSAFANDAGYLTQHQSLANYALKAEIPTKTSELTNDSGFLTQHQSLADYALKAEVPNKVSDLQNDAGYLTEHQSLSAYALKTEIPIVPTNISAFVNDEGYLTEHQSLSAYALKSEIPTVPTDISAFTNDVGYLTEHQSLTAYALKTEIPTVPTNVSAFTNDAGYLTQHQSLANYALKSELPTVPTNVSAFTNDVGYLTQHQDISGKQDVLSWDNEPVANSTKPVTSGGLYTKFNQVIEVASGKTASYVFDTVAEMNAWLGVSANVEKLKVGDVFLIRAVNVPDYWWDGSNAQILETTKVDLSGYALKTEIPTVPTVVSAFTNDAGYLTQHQSLSAYALKSEIPMVPTDVSAFNNDAGYLTEHQSLSAYALKTEIPTVPTNVSAFTNDVGYLTQHQSLANYALKSELPTVPTNVSAFTNDAGYLTSHQSLSAYALKTDIPTVPTNVSAFTNDAGYLTSHQSLTAYALKTELPTKTSQLTNDSGFLTQHQSLANYALKSELPTVPTNVSAFTNDAGYLTQHQSLANYALKSELPSNPLTLSEKQGFNCNNLYDGKIWLVGSGSNCPSGSQYGALFVLPYRQASGNTSPDFGAQIFLPNGDDSTKPNSMFYRTSLKNTWNAWQEVAVEGKCNADKLDGYHVSVVSALPSSPNASTIYFIT